MNEPEMNSPESSDLNGQVAALQRQVFSLLLALIVIGGTLTAFLFYQSHVLGKDIEAFRPQAMPIIQTFNVNHANMEKFVQQLVVYSQTHPDFRPVLQKYGINPLAPPPGAPKR